MHGLVAVRSIAISLAIALLISMGGVSTAVAAGTLTAPTPTVSGTVKIGSKLTASPGTWKPAPVTLRYQWLRSGVAISGATASTYTLVGSDAAKIMSVKVTGTKSGYTTASKTSKATAKVLPGTLTAPVPTVSGTLSVGSKLTANPGTWTSGTALKYQWLRSGAAISGATTSAYTLAAADLSKVISVRVTGAKAGYTSVVNTSAVTAAVKVGTLSAPVPKVSGTLSVGSKLTATPGTWTSGTVLKYQWLRSGVAISGATASAYTLLAADLSKTISVRVSGSKTGYTSVTKTSAATTAVKAGALSAPIPTVSGTLAFGSKLTAASGTWSSGTVLKYQWLRSGVAIPGATASSYTLVAADIAKPISVSVTGMKTGFTTLSKTSAATAPVKAATLTGPVPTISGKATVSSTLTAVPGIWTAGTALTYQWFRSGVAISGATASTYAVGIADVTKTISVRVTGSRAGFATLSKTSTATASVQPLALTAPVPTITGNTTVGSKLTAVPGAWTAGTTLNYQWLRSGSTITGATSPTYTLVAADASTTITVRVTGVKAGYTTVSKTSATTAPVAQAGTTIAPATISTDTTWSSGIYLLNENLTVAKGATLTIQAGVQVKAIDYSWVSLIVDGTLIINGTAAAPVVFTSLLDDTAGGDTNNDGDATTPSAGDWGGIAVGDHGSMTAKNSNIRYMGTGIDANNSDLVDISSSSIQASEYGGINVRVDRSGINAGTATINIRNNTVSDTGNVGIFVSATGTPQGSGTQIPVPTVQNNTVNNAGSYAIQVSGDKLDGALLTGNGGTGNQIDTINLDGTLTTNTTIPLGGLPLSLSDRNYGLTIAKGATMTINAGQVIKAINYGWAMLNVNGALTVNGTTAAPVVFTSLLDDTAGGDTNNDGDATTPAPGNWGGITVGEHGSLKVANSTIRYTGTGIDANNSDLVDISNSSIQASEYGGINVGVDRSGINAGTATINIRNNTVSDTGNVGISISATGTPQGSGTQIPVPTVQNNTVNNAGSYAIQISGDKLDGALLTGNGGTGNQIDTINLDGTLTTNTTIPLGGLPLSLSDRNYGLTIAKGATMTINAGQVIKAINDSWASLNVNGALTVNGTTAAPVVFTSLLDDTAGGDTNNDGDATTPAPGNWGGININEHGSATVTNSSIRHASTALHASNSDLVSVSNSTIQHSQGNGIYVQVDRSGINAGSATISIRNNTVTETGSEGIFVSATGTPQGSGTQIPVPTVQNNTVNNAGSYAIQVSGDKLDGALLTGNGGTGNQIDTINLDGTLTTNTTIPLGALPLSLSDRNYGLTIAKGATMTINAGQVIKAINDSWASLNVNGALTVNGTTAAPVVFTSLLDDTAGGDTNNDGDATTPAPGNWGGITVEEHASVKITNSSIRYTDTGVTASNSDLVEISNSSIQASEYGGINVGVDRSGINAGTATINIRNNTVSETGNVGISISATGTPQGTGTQIPVPVVQNNTVNGAGSYAIQITGDKLDGSLLTGNGGTGNQIGTINLGGTLTTNTTIPLGGLPLSLGRTNYGLTIAKGTTMTINAGQVIKASTYAWGGVTLTVDGTLVANGTASAPVIFTSLFDDTAGGDTNSDGDATTPAPDDWTGINISESGSITGTNLEVRYASTLLTSSGHMALIDAYLHDGVSCLLTTSGGQISGKIVSCPEGVNATGSTSLKAQAVDWGSDDGPPPFGPGTSIGGNIDIVPWVGYTAPAVVTEPQTVDPGVWICKPFMIFPVRGSGEIPAGAAADDPSLYDNFTYTEMTTESISEPGLDGDGNYAYAFRGMGGMIQKMLTAQHPVSGAPWLVDRSAADGHGLLDTLAERDNVGIDENIGIYPLIYPASDTQLLLTAVQPLPTNPNPIDTFGMRVNAGNLVEYLSSIDQGVQQLQMYLIDAASTCVDSTIILLGYSQGAMVIHLALADIAANHQDWPSRILDQVGGIMLLADPMRNSMDGVMTWGTASTESDAPADGLVTKVSQYSTVRSLIRNVFGGRLDGLTDPYPYQFSSITYAYCNNSDAVCAPHLSTFKAGFEIHTSYSTKALAAWSQMGIPFFAGLQSQ